jgi:hypothetical protein
MARSPSTFHSVSCDTMNELSQESLRARIDGLRSTMLAVRKDLGAAIEGGSVEVWPELREQLHALQTELSAVRLELHLLHRRNLGQSVIDACFPAHTPPQWMSISDDSALPLLCREAALRWIRVEHSSYGHAEVSLRCELAPASDKQILLDAGIKVPIIDIHLDACTSVLLNSRAEGAYWGDERISLWEVQPASAHNGYRCLHCIECSQGTRLEIEQWSIRISEGID